MRGSDLPPASWRRRVRGWIGERLGGWDHRRRPEWSAGYGPFNGQLFRQRLFGELMQRLAFVAIVETGTHRGTTTRYMRSVTRVPIHSFEASPRLHSFACEALRSLPDITLHRDDSRNGLMQLASARRLPPGPVFFYLDAHSDGELPLAREVELAFHHWPEAVVMIDDFAVPDDAGYGYDDFGEEGALTLEYLATRDLMPSAVWFPCCPSSEETGYRRGCVVLAQADGIASVLDGAATLRRWAAG